MSSIISITHRPSRINIQQANQYKTRQLASSEKKKLYQKKAQLISAKTDKEISEKLGISIFEASILKKALTPVKSGLLIKNISFPYLDIDVHGIWRVNKNNIFDHLSIAELDKEFPLNSLSDGTIESLEAKFGDDKLLNTQLGITEQITDMDHSNYRRVIAVYFLFNRGLYTKGYINSSKGIQLTKITRALGIQ